MYEQKPVNSNILLEAMVRIAPLQVLTNPQVKTHIYKEIRTGAFLFP